MVEAQTSLTIDKMSPRGLYARCTIGRPSVTSITLLAPRPRHASISVAVEAFSNFSDSARPSGGVHRSLQIKASRMVEFRRPLEKMIQFLYDVALHIIGAVILVAILKTGEYAFDVLEHYGDVTWQIDTDHKFTAADLAHWSDLGIFVAFIVSGVWNGIRNLGK